MRIPDPLSAGLTLEALYKDTGSIALFVGGEEQLTVNIDSPLTEGDYIALRALGRPVEFTHVFISAR